MALAPRSLEKRPSKGVALKALVVRFSAIGDCVMSVPVASAIRRKYPQGSIVWAVEPRCSPVIDTEILVSELSLFARDDWQSRRWSPRCWRDQLRTYLNLRKHDFDIGIDLQGQAKTALCLRLARPKKRIAVKSHDVLSARLNPILDVDRGGMHVVEHGMLGLSKLGDFPTDIEFVMPRLESEMKHVGEMLSRQKPLVTISVSAGGLKKVYPLPMWEEVAKRLAEDGMDVAFLGGPGDPISGQPGTIDLVGKLTLRQSMAAIRLSAVHLAADTGSGHIAAAYGVPVVSVFGRTPPSAFRPYTKKGIVLDGEGSPTNVQPGQIVDALRAVRERHSETISH